MSGRLSMAVAGLLVAIAFAIALGRIWTRQQVEFDPDRVVIRLGHWLLHAGMREAFAEAAADYERLHPHVRVEQVAVPIRSWGAWMRTQLIGGTAPDITGQLGTNEEIINRHFLPLSDWLEQPNPYNVGTPLEGLRWRDTFIDGLNSMRDRTPTSGEIGGIYLQLNVLRLFYNRRLLREVTGSDAPPTTYAELRALEGQVADYNASTGRKLVPIASCGPYAQYLFSQLLPSQTQRLTIELSPMATLQTPNLELARLMLKGAVSYDTPELRASLRLLRDVTSLMSPGFKSLQRDDALFAFLQQHALMIAAGSWDYAVFVRDGDFETGITHIPLPTRDDPEYGRFVLGPNSEAGGSTEAMLGVVRTSRHPEVAVDFLRFLTSHRVATRFMELSLRMSAIADVPPPEGAPGLRPRLGGEVPGFMPDFTGFGGGHAFNAFQRNIHLALGRTGDLDELVRRLDAEIPAALRQDVAFHRSRVLGAIQRLDTHLGLALTLPGDDPFRAQWSRFLEAQHTRHAEWLRYGPAHLP